MPKTKFFKFTGLDGKKHTLSMKEKIFCEKYLGFSGNGVEAIYLAGYKPSNAKVAASMAYENLIKPHISAYVNLLLEEYGFTDENALKQHLFLMNQFGNLNAKAKAVDMFYKRKGDYAPTKHTFIDPHDTLSDEELEDEQRRIERKIEKRVKEQADKKAKKSS